MEARIYFSIFRPTISREAGWAYEIVRACHLAMKENPTNPARPRIMHFP